jgi:hypothetical protein
MKDSQRPQMQPGRIRCDLQKPDGSYVFPHNFFNFCFSNVSGKMQSENVWKFRETFQNKYLQILWCENAGET